MKALSTHLFMLRVKRRLRELFVEAFPPHQRIRHVHLHYNVRRRFVAKVRVKWNGNEL